MNSILVDVVDAKTGSALEGATISVNGTAVGKTDALGNYPVYVEDTDIVTASYVGYDSISVQGGLLEETGQIQLGVKAQGLPSVIVTPSPTEKKIPWLLIGGVAAGALLLSKKSGASGVGKINKQTGMIALGLVAVGGVYLLTRPKPTPGINPASSFGPARIPNSGPSSNPGTALNIMSQSGGILKAISNLFASPSPNFPPNAPYQPVQQSITDNPPAFTDPAANYPSLPIEAPPPLDIIAPVDATAIDPYAGASGADFSQPVAGVGALDMTTALPIAALAAVLLLGSKKK